MLVVERDYNRFKEGFHPDLILDATTCIVLQNLADLHDQGKSVSATNVQFDTIEFNLLVREVVTTSLSVSEVCTVI